MFISTSFAIENVAFSLNFICWIEVHGMKEKFLMKIKWWIGWQLAPQSFYMGANATPAI